MIAIGSPRVEHSMSRSFFSRRRVLLFGPALALFFLVFLCFQPSDIIQDETDPADPDLTYDVDSDELRDVCNPHGLTPYNHKRSVYDLILINHELDWLEIRLHEHARHVDYFVILESRTTLSGKPKPLYLQENWGRFSVYHAIIIHRIVDTPFSSSSDRPAQREQYLRNALLTDGVSSIEGTPQEAHPGDVLLVSDVNEILRQDTLYALRHCDIPKRTNMLLISYLYSFQWRRKDVHWNHPQATTFGARVNDTILPHDLRFSLPNSPGHHSATIKFAGWRCVLCYATAADVIVDLQSRLTDFRPKAYSSDVITTHVKNGVPLVDLAAMDGEIEHHKDEEFERMEVPPDVPDSILAGKGWTKMRYLYKFDDPGAGWEVNWNYPPLTTD